MLDKIKKLKVLAIKKNNEEGKLERDAYNAVLASVQLAQTKLVNDKLIEVDDAVVISIIKKEIKVFEESASSNPKILEDFKSKAKILEGLLPKQLSDEDVSNFLAEYTGNKNPKEFMKFLDDKGYVGCYNKGSAASLVLKK